MLKVIHHPLVKLGLPVMAIGVSALMLGVTHPLTLALGGAGLLANWLLKK